MVRRDPTLCGEDDLFSSLLVVEIFVNFGMKIVFACVVCDFFVHIKKVFQLFAVICQQKIPSIGHFKNPLIGSSMHM